jgi:hypothetical protein
MPQQPITLVTSLAPHNADNQRRAMDSWRHAGFSVTSLNAEPEIDQVRKLFPDMDVRAVARDASADCGRPLVYLDDAFAHLRENGSQVCGLVNSDIHLRSDESTIRYVTGEARGSLVLASRTDLDSLESRHGETFKHGFDVFLFDRAILDLVPASRFCLGQPWWDYWFPACFIRPRRPVPLKLVTFPFIAHVRHPSDWNRHRNFEKYGLHCLQFFEPARAQELAKQSPDPLRLSVGQYSVQVAQAIWRHSRWLSPPRPAADAGAG